MQKQGHGNLSHVADDTTHGTEDDGSESGLRSVGHQSAVEMASSSENDYRAESTGESKQSIDKNSYSQEAKLSLELVMAPMVIELTPDLVEQLGQFVVRQVLGP